VNGILKVGTLRDIFNNCDERILACLDLPTSSMDVVATPGLRYNTVLLLLSTLLICAVLSRELASDRWAWLQTRGSAGFRRDAHPIDTMNWATVATKFAVSRAHEDTEGFGTSTQILTGSKYWTIFTPDPTVGPHSTRGDLGSISGFPRLRDFQDHKFRGWMRAEAVLLGPNDLL
jgi:hypothetical protein